MQLSSTGYAKYDGMLLAQKYLPRQVVFDRINVIQVPRDWYEIEDEFDSDLLLYRLDAPRGLVRPQVNSSGKPEDVLRCLAQAKAIVPSAVLLMITPRWPVVPRYANDGGFCVGFEREKEAIVELVGKGFDGHELTRQVTAHERMVLSWKDARLDSRGWSEVYRDNYAVISPDDYAQHQSQRIAMLHRECNFSVTELESVIPTTYQPLMSSELVRSLQTLVIVPIMAQTMRLYQDGLSFFAVQGNFVNGIPQVWEIFTP